MRNSVKYLAPALQSDSSCFQRIKLCTYT